VLSALSDGAKGGYCFANCTSNLKSYYSEVIWNDLNDDGGDGGDDAAIAIVVPFFALLVIITIISPFIILFSSSVFANKNNPIVCLN